jgi:hypothetical protein
MGCCSKAGGTRARDLHGAGKRLADALPRAWRCEAVVSRAPLIAVALVCSGCGGVILDDSKGPDAGADRQAPMPSADAESDADVDADVPDAGDECTTATLPAPTAFYVSDPEATFEQTDAGFSLIKNLSGYESNYDVLIIGQSAQWSFEIPTPGYTPHIKSAIVVLQLVADNHDTPIGGYSYELWAGSDNGADAGVCEYDSPVPLPHASPASGPFTNWTPVVENALVSPWLAFTVALSNTSAANPGDWIGVQSIVLQVTLQ